MLSPKGKQSSSYTTNAPSQAYKKNAFNTPPHRGRARPRGSFPKRVRGKGTRGFRDSLSVCYKCRKPGRICIEYQLRIFQRFRQVKFIEKFKTRFKNLKIQKIIAFDKYLHELFFAFYFHLSKNLFLSLKNNEVADLTHFSTNCRCFSRF